MEEVEAPDKKPGQVAEGAGDAQIEDLEDILKGLLDYACEQGMIEDSIAYRDLFDTKIMSVLMPCPSEVIRTFWELYKKESPQAATEYYYNLSRNSDYIRRYRIVKDQKWVTPTSYGDLDITINLSKPEKDPKAIAATKMQNKRAIRNVCFVWKMKAMQAG